jgi:hypothetical protein
VLAVLGATIAGAGYRRFVLQELVNGSANLGSKCFSSLQKLILNVFKQISLNRMAKEIEALKALARKIQKGEVISLDFGWTQRRNAFGGWLVVTWRRKVICFIPMWKQRKRKGKVVVEGNTDEGSNGMESAALQKAITKDLNDQGLFDEIPPPINLNAELERTHTHTRARTHVCSPKPRTSTVVCSTLSLFGECVSKARSLH